MPQPATKARNERFPSAQQFAAESIPVNFLHAQNKSNASEKCVRSKIAMHKYSFCSTKSVELFTFLLL